MSFLENLKAQPKEKISKQPKEIKKNESFKQDIFKINPEVKTINDIPNTNIMTSGKLIGVRLRANKKKMLEDLRSYIDNLLESEEK